MSKFGWCVALAVSFGAAAGAVAQDKAGEAMAATVMRQWPAGVITSMKSPGAWTYEEGTLLDGMIAEWKTSGNAAEFAYVKASVDRYILPDGTIQMTADGKPFPMTTHTLDDIEFGRAVMAVYHETHEAKYGTAAKFLRARLAEQPRTASGGYWHKQIYPNQMWLDGAYMGEPFHSAYATDFHHPEEFSDIAKQLLLMDEHMVDPKSGLLRHGWDESKAMPWADKQTGLSPAAWGRAMGWYCMALVDVLDWMPKDNPDRVKLIAVLRRVMGAVVAVQDPDTGLWWQVMDRGRHAQGQLNGKGQVTAAASTAADKGNFLEASASAMFVYALAKGVRMGYLDRKPYEADARRGWEGIQTKFVSTAANGDVTFSGTVKVGGLGGTPYRSGTPEYYYSGEALGDQDAKGVGAYLLAASEMGRVTK